MFLNCWMGSSKIAWGQIKSKDKSESRRSRGRSREAKRSPKGGAELDRPGLQVSRLSCRKGTVVGESQGARKEMPKGFEDKAVRGDENTKRDLVRQ